MQPKTDPRWRKLAAGEIKTPLKCLALKILVSRTALTISRDPGKIGAATDEVYDFFQKNAKMAEADYRAIFG